MNCVIATDRNSFLLRCQSLNLPVDETLWIHDIESASYAGGRIEFAHGFWTIDGFDEITNILANKFHKDEIILPGWYIGLKDLAP